MLGASLAHLPFKRHPIQRPPSVILQFLSRISLKLRQNHFGVKTTSCLQFAGWTALTNTLLLLLLCTGRPRRIHLSHFFTRFSATHRVRKELLKLGSPHLSGKFSELTDERPNQPAAESQAAPKVGQQQRRRWEAERGGSCKKTAGRGWWWEWTHYRGPCVLPSPRQPHMGGSRRAKMLACFVLLFPFRWKRAELGLVRSKKQKRTEHLKAKPHMGLLWPRLAERLKWDGRNDPRCKNHLSAILSHLNGIFSPFIKSCHWHKKLLFKILFKHTNKRLSTQPVGKSVCLCGTT